MLRRSFCLHLVAPVAGLAAAATLPGCAATGATAPSVDEAGRLDWFVFLESGRTAPRGTPAEQAALAEMQRLHIENFKRLHGLKTLFAAGPLRDPAGTKRGIVWVKARSRDELPGLFAPDPYVSGGYMTLNAQPAHVHRALRSEGIDPNGVEEVRIVKISRGSAPPTAAARTALLQQGVDDGTFGAWFTLTEGPLAEVLFARTKDEAPLLAALAGYPGLGRDGVELRIWAQWIGRGVVPGDYR